MDRKVTGIISNANGRIAALKLECGHKAPVPTTSFLINFTRLPCEQCGITPDEITRTTRITPLKRAKALK